MQAWTLVDQLCRFQTRWLTLVGEHLEDGQGRRLEYWRVEKDDSLIVLALQAGKILLPAPAYRPGIQACTLDLPGGRLKQGEDPLAVAASILERELGLNPAHIESLTPLSRWGWAVNSSFSNQRLYALVAQIQPDAPAAGGVADRIEASQAGITTLLRNIDCLQCRAVLLEWWLGSPTPAD